MGLSAFIVIVEFLLIFKSFAGLEELSNPNPNLGLDLFRECISNAAGLGLPSTLIVTRTTNPEFYARLNHQWNIRKPVVHPLAYFVPRSTPHVQAGVRCASQIGVRVIPKSGGHSYESYSFGNSETIIIDFKQMDEIAVDPAEKTATIQPGALLGQIYWKLWNESQLSLPMGDGMTVGIGGFTLGGGFGYFSNKFGLALDNLAEAVMVDARGEAHLVNETQNSELFWALRGVGSGYIGVVTSLKFNLFQASALRIERSTLVYENIGNETGIRIMESWQDWMIWSQKNAAATQTRMSFSGTEVEGEIAENRSQVRIEISIVQIFDKLNQTRTNRDLVLNRALEIFPCCAANVSSRTWDSYMDFVIETANYAVLNATPLPLQESQLQTIKDKWISPKFVKQKLFYVNQTFERGQFGKVVSTLLKFPAHHVHVDFTNEGGVPGAGAVSPSATAFVHRSRSGDGDGDLLYYVVFGYENSENVTRIDVDDDEGMSWTQEFAQVTKFMDSGSSYQNYNDVDLKDYLSRYYGANLKRLISVKQKWDPDNYFQNPESLPTSSE